MEQQHDRDKRQEQQQPEQPPAPKRMGATEEQVTPIAPPTKGPRNPDTTPRHRQSTDEQIDPADELTPG